MASKEDVTLMIISGFSTIITLKFSSHYTTNCIKAVYKDAITFQDTNMKDYSCEMSKELR